MEVNNEPYDNNILKSLEYLNVAIPYYMGRIKELEKELEVYKKAYENRVDAYLNDNHIPHID